MQDKDANVRAKAVATMGSAAAETALCSQDSHAELLLLLTHRLLYTISGLYCLDMYKDLAHSLIQSINHHTLCVLGLLAWHGHMGSNADLKIVA